jgi:predicted PurR-regulated permease PerM
MEPAMSDEQFKNRAWWLVGLLLLLFTLYMIREALAVVFTAFIFASALLPLVEWLDRKLPRWAAVLIPFSVFMVVGIGIVMPIIGIALQQLQLFINDFPQYLEQIRLGLNDWSFLIRRYPYLARFSPEALLEQISTQNAHVFSGFTGATMVISQVALDVLSALVISVFLLLDRERIQHYFLRFYPTGQHDRLNTLIDHLIRSTGAFVTGQLLFMISFGSLIALGLYLIGLPFPVLLGFLAGILTIIPILGPNIAMIPTLVIALLTPGGVFSALWVFLLFIGVQIIENNIIGPLIMGRAVGLHPLAILISLLVGGMMFGMVGVILAIPVAACLNILLKEWFMDPERRRERRAAHDAAAALRMETGA